ncbi:unnamed protein product [Cylindrotheca closterium]|uniref:Peptidase A1 domain-containing protein n=1 Tax=Cylindrotheca closterium TaxID=2856 RepID=A0AAD2FQX4_9STRA|nr:unnamed protein product [Cylindrotheca closterium]
MLDIQYLLFIFLLVTAWEDAKVTTNAAAAAAVVSDGLKQDWTSFTFDLQPASARLHIPQVSKTNSHRRRHWQHFGLNDTIRRYLGRNQRRHHNKRERNDGVLLSTNDFNREDLPEEWFHPNSNAVYATFHGTDNDDHPARIDFDKFRHWSRYERLMRHQLQESLESSSAVGNNQTLLQPHWDGDYEKLKPLLLPLPHPEDRNRDLQQFERYQSAPLSQGFGTHYIHLWIGSPLPQRQSVIVDTGSRYTAFPCEGCKDCGQEHHTDPYFQPSVSESFQPLECPLECMGHATCSSEIDEDSDNNSNTNNNGHCYFSQAYTEGSSWMGYQAKDLVYCGGRDLLQAASQLDTNYSIPFMFGCLQEESGLFVTQLADGIMGLSAQEHTLPKQLYNLGKIEYNMFALCFRRELGSSKRGVTAGTMTLGGVSSTLDTSPMIYAKNTQTKGWYTVSVKRIYIAKNGGRQFLFDSRKAVSSAKEDIVPILIDEDVVNSGKGVIVDSGTTDTYLNANALPAFSKVWRSVTGMEYKHKPIALTDEQLQVLPTVLVQFQAASSSFENYLKPVLGQVGMLDPKNSMDVLLAIPATSYMEYMPTMKMYASRLYFTETSGGVLGANAMQGYNVLFDWQHHRIGFSQSSCAYDLIEKEEQEKFGEIRDANPSGVCRLGRPILTTPCMDSIDVSICQASDNPTNVKIMGTETWTRLVLDPGKETDSCPSVMEDWSLRQNIQMEPSEIRCDHDGHCQEIRPCQVPCMVALDLASATAGIQSTKKKAGKTNVEGTGNCASTTKVWSACDYKCEQTKVSAALDDQDVCVESSREIRSCHTGACCRFDACLVPYLVQTILVLEGIEIDDWDMHKVEDFKTQLASLASRKSGWTRRRRKFFGAGDINVLSIQPWNMLDEAKRRTVEEDELSKENDDSAGIQLIIQISVFNPKAKTKPQDKLHRSLLREVEAQWSNTSASSDHLASSNCKALEMYSLAKDAVYLSTEWLKQPKFEVALAKGLPKVSRARVISAWTINTQIYDDEINYFGPIGSRWGPYIFGFRLFFELIYKACFIWIVCTFLFYSLDRCCILFNLVPLRQRWRSFILRVCKWRVGNKRSKFEELTPDDFEEIVESFEFELTTADYSKERSTTPKRRNLSSEA